MAHSFIGSCIHSLIPKSPLVSITNQGGEQDRQGTGSSQQVGDRQTDIYNMCFDRETQGTGGTEEGHRLRNCGGVKEGLPKGVMIKAQREGEQQLDQGRWRGCRGKSP